MAELGFKSFQGEIPVCQLREFIGVNDIIGVKVNSEAEWINDVIEEIREDGSILEIRLLNEFISLDLMVDDIIQCRYIKEDIEYVIEAKVDDIGILNARRVMLEPLKVKTFENARNSKRYTVNLCGRATYNEGENVAFVTIKNISRTGISITCRENIGINEEVDIDIVLWQKEVLSLEGKIVRMLKVGNNYRFGIVIENIEQKNNDILEEFIDQLESKEKDIL